MFSAPETMLSNYIRKPKQYCLLVCLLQGLLSIGVGLYVLTYMPEVLEDPKETVPEVTLRPKINKTNIHLISDILSSKDGENYHSFRYDKFISGFEYDNWINLVTDQGKYACFQKEYMRDEIPDWFKFKEVFCGGCLSLHGKRIGYLRNATIDPDLANGNIGGDEISSVLGQPLEAEFLSLVPGFTLTASDEDLVVLSNYTLNVELRTFLNSLKVVTHDKFDYDTGSFRDKTAVLVTRYEYANFYHSTMNWYDTFLIMVIYNIEPKNLHVYWVDAHPKSKLDEMWETLFGKCRRVKALRNKITYKEMVWNGNGGRSQINAHKLEDLPFVEEYRHFVITRFGITADHIRNCQQLRVTIIWRRSYVAHPRNERGFVPRQIYNENEVWETVSTSLPSAIVNGVQLDRLTLTEQLELIATTDILIGMHGAGLSHIMYLPKTSGVIEFFTMRTSSGNAHFRSMARWRRLPYLAWVNSRMEFEMKDHKTQIPIGVLSEMVHSMRDYLCGSDKSLNFEPKKNT